MRPTPHFVWATKAHPSSVANIAAYSGHLPARIFLPFILLINSTTVLRVAVESANSRLQRRCPPADNAPQLLLQQEATNCVRIICVELLMWAGREDMRPRHRADRQGNLAQSHPWD